MREYGYENFTIELLEEDNDNPSEKEIYWIEKLNSRVPNGYNIALGGEGRKTVTSQEKEEIIALYKSGKPITTIQKETQRDTYTITNILQEYNIPITENWKYFIKKIGQYDNQGNLIAIYDSIAEIEKQLSNGKSHGHISACAKGKRKKAYGYYWRYID